MDFVKMHGLGNDFVVLNFLDGSPYEEKDYPGLAKNMCDRKFGIGADGIILTLPSQKEDIKMRIFNSDGSEAEMCGNGIRCFAKYVYEKNILRKTKMRVETLAGTIIPQLNVEKGKVINITVDMGKPRLERSSIPMKGPKGRVVSEDFQVEQNTYKITAVSMGNPHCVIFVDDLGAVYLEKLGPKIENHPVFPQKTNVEFVEVVSPEEINMRVWERGAGETLACGTGACASVVAAVLNGKTNREVTVNLPGGKLYINWSKEDNRVYMTGPAVKVFEGRYYIKA